MKVLKFGGTSVGTPTAIQAVVQIVQQSLAAEPVAVVVSAFGGVTNQLLAAADAAAKRDESYDKRWSELRRRHVDAARQLVGTRDAALMARIDELFAELHELLRGAYLLREASARARDSIASYGERLSAEVVAAAFRANGQDAWAVDTRQVIVTDAHFGKATVEIERSYAQIRAAVASAPSQSSGSNQQCLPIFTGFIGATAEGQTTTLGRGGSDYTGALVGAALGASAVEIWTDVDGVLTADPRTVPTAFSQPEMSYAELMELSHFGAKVIYPPSIHPARAAGIPLWIKNTFNPSHPGTVVRETREVATPAADAPPICGISSIRQVALARLEGDGMVGVPGIAERLFGALARQNVSVILICQSSSEHSICFAITEADAPATRRAVDEAFALEQRLGLIQPLIVELGQAVIAAVGAQMARRPGIAGRVFGVLGAEGVNVRAIAQGSSELNISLVVDGADEAKALRAIHQTFFGPRSRVLEVAILGAGRVGSVLLEQIAAAAPELQTREGLELRLVVLSTRSHQLLTPTGHPWGDAVAALAQAPAPSAPLDAVLDGHAHHPRVVVDVTADGSAGELYPRLLAQGIGVVAANKKPFTANYPHWQNLLAAARQGGAPLLFETTVGAGLPILATLRDWRRTGDPVTAIAGVLSGTINAVFSRLAADLPFSAALRAAYDQGLTEPHPYDDLAGADVQRKLCILARLAGFSLELDQIQVTPVLPASPWAELSLDELWRQLPAVDAELEARRAAAAARGCRLRYLATLDAQGARVGLVEVEPSHPAYGLEGPDNLVALHSARYHASPLVIRGPGAGPAVTAAGVFADLLAAADRLT